MLANRQQTAFLRGNGDTGARMCVNDAVDFGPRRMHATMNDKAGTIDAESRQVFDDVAILVDLDQAGRRDLIEHQTVRIDQHVLAAGHPGSEMRKDQVGPAKLRCKLVSRCKIATNLPLFITDACAQTTGVNGGKTGLGVHDTSSEQLADAATGRPA